jgi:uncharacterized protein
MSRKLSNQLDAWLEDKPVWLRDIAQMPVVDTHEHLMLEEDRLKSNDSVMSWIFSQYITTDFAGAGMPREINDHIRITNQSTSLGIDDAGLMETLKEYWPLVKNTGYAQVINRYFSLRFGISEFDPDNYKVYQELMNTELQPGFYKRLFAEANVIAVQNCPDPDTLLNTEPYEELFYRDFRPDRVCAENLLSNLATVYGRSLESFEEIEALVDDGLKKAAEDSRCIAIKIGLAYAGSLNFTEPSEAEMQSLRALAGDELRSNVHTHLFKSWLVRKILKAAPGVGLPVKFHTGHFAGPYSENLETISRNLIDLQKLIQEFPDTQFVIMHHCWPYGEAAAVLAKSYPNCYIDQCWLWAMNPVAGVRYLKEFLSSAPSNKLFAFGGDYRYPECSVGHLDLALHGVCTALYELVREGWMTPETATTCAENILHKNQQRLFNM